MAALDVDAKSFVVHCLYLNTLSQAAVFAYIVTSIKPLPISFHVQR